MKGQLLLSGCLSREMEKLYTDILTDEHSRPNEQMGKKMTEGQTYDAKTTG